MDLIQAMYYESVFFSEDIRIITFEKLDECFIIHHIEPMKLIMKKHQENWDYFQDEFNKDVVDYNKDGDLEYVKEGDSSSWSCSSHCSSTESDAQDEMLAPKDVKVVIKQIFKNFLVPKAEKPFGENEA